MQTLKQRKIRRFCSALDSIEATWSLNFLERPTGKNRYLLVEPSKNQKNCLILYLHGLGNDLFFPQHQLFFSMVEQGYSILSVDLDGHGLDSSSQFSDRHVETFIDSISYIVKKHQKKSCWFVGYSLGGVVGAHGLSNCEIKFDGAIFIGAPNVKPPVSAMIWETLTIGKKPFYRSILTYGISGFIPALGEFGRRAFPVRLAQNETEDYFTIARRIIANYPLFVSIKKLRMPILLCNGSLDRIASKLDAIKNFCAQNNHVRFKVIDGATHHTCLLEPQLVNTLTNFIKENT